MDAAPDENLAERLQQQLPEDLFGFVRRAGEMASRRQQRLYLVGGVVRDLLLERCNLDLDLVVEGDAISLAQEIAASMKAGITTHSRFGTATIEWRHRRADFVAARAESYARPGALPAVRPGNLRDDLARRDFTVNAMAVALDPAHFGEVVDPYDGRGDIKKGFIRVLHDISFVDDATRIWRAVRYEQRLAFLIEPGTLKLLRRDIDRLGTVSGDRIRHELELVLKEEEPEKALGRAGGLGVLARVHPSLKADDWLAETIDQARRRCSPAAPTPDLYLALLSYRLAAAETEQLISYLRLPKKFSEVLRDTAAVKGRLGDLSSPGLAPSLVYERLQGYHLTALLANSLGSGSATAAEHIELYLNVLRYVKPALDGDDLMRLGVAVGPPVKDILRRLRQARLDGKIDSQAEEEEMVRGIILEQ
jgi:tRNA nucleotidyltransferase (CCA-adding enzyme)